MTTLIRYNSNNFNETYITVWRTIIYFIAVLLRGA